MIFNKKLFFIIFDDLPQKLKPKKLSKFHGEKKLLKRLKNSDCEAYKQLYNVYYKDMLVYCMNLTHNVPQAKDIVQNTFIKIWTKRKSISITTSFKNYLYRAVFNNFSNHYKRKIKEKVMFLKLKNESLNTILETNDNLKKEKLKLIKDSIEKLPPRCKQVFLMHKMRGYRYKEIAEELDISEKAVEKNISRAIRRIKEVVCLKTKTTIS